MGSTQKAVSRFGSFPVLASGRLYGSVAFWPYRHPKCRQIRLYKRILEKWKNHDFSTRRIWLFLVKRPTFLITKFPILAKNRFLPKRRCFRHPKWFARTFFVKKTPFCNTLFLTFYGSKWPFLTSKRTPRRVLFYYVTGHFWRFCLAAFL